MEETSGLSEEIGRLLRSVGAGLQTRPYKRLPIMIIKAHQRAREKGVVRNGKRLPKFSKTSEV